VAPNTEARAAAAPTAATATNVGWLTGPNTNTYQRFRISGTDLGIMWDNGQTGANKQVLIAFGDTFGDCTAPDQQWRKNTLFRSSDRDLANGMDIPAPVFGDKYSGSPVLSAQQPNFSRQVIASLNLAATEVTVIPTAGIAVGTRQYVNFMSVSKWGNPGQWSTNFSAVAVSDDNGENWTVPQTSIRPSWFNTVPGIPFVWGYQNFQMAAYLRYNGYVYNYGTGAGRGGMPFLARVPEAQVADRDAYEYYTPFGWLKGLPFLAIQVVWAPGSEMSVAWNDYLKKFVMLYTNTLSDVVMRTADKPEGPWSSAETILTSASMPGGIYAPYIHPWSSGSDLYFTLSLWSNYSVMLMRTKLSSPIG
jgi:D-arabinan endo alpha-(1,5)-arabinofuranosidase